MSRKLLIVAALALATQLTGCAVNRATGHVEPDANLRAAKTVHVVKIPNETADIDTLIADNLRRRGYTVTTGTDKRNNVDVQVTYVDRWMWDITMYLLELTITLRDAKSDYPLAVGNSFHTSLTRKSPPEMVDEVLGNIFKEVKP